MAFATASTTAIDAQPALLQPYQWNTEMLSSFTFLMAGHGSAVCASMMLGDADYAREQLRLACTLDDHELQQVAVQMLSSSAHLTSALVDAARWSH